MKLKINEKNSETAAALKKQEESLVLFENSLNKTKEEILLTQSQLAQEKIVFEQEKWKLDQQFCKLQEQEGLFSVKLEHFQLEKSDFEKEMTQFKILKSKFDEEKENFLKEKQNALDSELRFFGDVHQELSTFNISNENSVAYLDYKSQELADRENEIELAYAELNEQMNKFNKELEEKEQELNLQSDDIKAQYEELQKKKQEFATIESCLIESQAQIEEFRLNTIPEYEIQSLALQELMKSLHEQQKELKHLVKKLNKEIVSVQKIKGNLDVIQECNSDDSPSSDSSADSFEFIANKIVDTCKKKKFKAAAFEKRSK